jgi:hypothetical protein
LGTGSRVDVHFRARKLSTPAQSVREAVAWVTRKRRQRAPAVIPDPGGSHGVDVDEFAS